MVVTAVMMDMSYGDYSSDDYDDNDDGFGNDVCDGSDSLFEAFLKQKYCIFSTNFDVNHGTIEN